MSLLKEIQDAAVNDSTPLAVLLRKCMVLAATLDNDTLREWASHELNGYSSKEALDALPDYRKLHAPAHGSFSNGYYWYDDLPIPASLLPKKSRHFGETAFLP